MTKIEYFKNFNMGKELQNAGEFVFESASKMYGLVSFYDDHIINLILYNGSVGIERLQKILICLYIDTFDDLKIKQDSQLLKHNHGELQRKLVEKKIIQKLSKCDNSLLELFGTYYNKYRYKEYSITDDNSINDLFCNYLNKYCEEKCGENIRLTICQKDKIKKFYINTIGKLAKQYFDLIEKKARDLNLYTYEILPESNAATVYWIQNDLYDEFDFNSRSIKELLLFLVKSNNIGGIKKLMNELNPLDIDSAMINEYLYDLVSNRQMLSLKESISELYNNIDNAELKNRVKIIDLIGDPDCYLNDLEDIEEEY